MTADGWRDTRLSRRVLMAIKQSGRSRNEISRAAGQSHAAINNWLRGNYSISIDGLETFLAEIGWELTATPKGLIANDGSPDKIMKGN